MLPIIGNPRGIPIKQLPLPALRQKKGVMAVNRINRFWLPVFACMGFIFYASSIPGSNIPCLFPFQDTLFHFFVYSALGFFYYRALKSSHPTLAEARLISYTVAFGIIYGITDELHQKFVPYRTFAYSDILFDGLGSLFGNQVCRWLR